MPGSKSGQKIEPKTGIFGRPSLGVSKTRNGIRIGKTQAQRIINLFKDIPEYSQFGFTHFEVIQLYVLGISKDRISDIACNYIKSFLIDYTIEQCELNGIPTEGTILDSIYNYKTNTLDINQKAYLPVNPVNRKPLIFTPKRWLRFNQWINFEDYFLNVARKFSNFLESPTQ